MIDFLDGVIFAGSFEASDWLDHHITTGKNPRTVKRRPKPTGKGYYYMEMEEFHRRYRPSSEARRIMDGTDPTDPKQMAILHDALLDEGRDAEAELLTGDKALHVIFHEGHVFLPHQLPTPVVAKAVRQEMDRFSPSYTRIQSRARWGRNWSDWVTLESPVDMHPEQTDHHYPAGTLRLYYAMGSDPRYSNWLVPAGPALERLRSMRLHGFALGAPGRFHKPMLMSLVHDNNNPDCMAYADENFSSLVMEKEAIHGHQVEVRSIPREDGQTGYYLRLQTRWGSAKPFFMGDLSLSTNLEAVKEMGRMSGV